MVLRLVMVLFSALMILGCAKNTNPTGSNSQDHYTSRIILDARWMRLTEGTYHFTDPARLSDDCTGYLVLSLRLETWPEHYGLEYFVLAESEFNKFKENLSFEAVSHQTITTKGTCTDSTEIRHDQDYRIVIDNTDAGWEKTDSDSTDDNPVFHVTVWLWEKS